eukprot:11914599-Prorocentrum_lima.AAC.1
MECAQQSGSVSNCNFDATLCLSLIKGLASAGPATVESQEEDLVGCAGDDLVFSFSSTLLPFSSPLCPPP